MAKNTALGPLLRSAREKAGLTQSELARRVGIAPNHVTRLESEEKSNPRFETVARLAVELGLSLDDIAFSVGYRGPVRGRAKDSAVAVHAVNRLRVALQSLELLDTDIRTALASLEKAARPSVPLPRAKR